ncbi:GNAT family N-acetyltransferase [Chloroflexota bacterium]
MVIIGKKVQLRDKKLADAADDYGWQTDSELTRLDTVSPLTITFPEYLSGYTTELRYPSPSRRLFAIDTLDGEHIGNCVYYGIDETGGEAELGVMIGARGYWDKGYGAEAVASLVKHIFCETNLQRIYLKTLNSNERAQKCFRKCGFIPCGRLIRGEYNFVLMELLRERWEEYPSLKSSSALAKI